MRRLLSHLTYANVMATVAIAMSLGGTAFAAVVVTGRNVRDSTLTSIDVRNGSLSAADLSLTARRSLRGPRGATGLTGPRGLTGIQGPKGDTGAPGAPAEVVTSYASRDTGYMDRVDALNPNPNDRVWFEYNCSSGVVDGDGTCTNDDGNQNSAGVGDVPLIASDTLVVALQGMPARATNESMTSNNAISVPWANNLTGMASVSLLHLGPTGSTFGIHERVQCSLKYANSANPNTFTALGEPQMVSAFATREVVNLSFVGSANLQAGTYNVKIDCSDMDYASDSDHGWRFIAGNLTVMAARNA